MSTFGRSGETGIHARLKILCSQQAWGFDSLLRHKNPLVLRTISLKKGDFLGFVLYNIKNGNWRPPAKADALVSAGRRFPPEADQPVAEASVSIPILNNKHFDKTTGIGAIG